MLSNKWLFLLKSLSHHTRPKLLNQIKSQGVQIKLPVGPTRGQTDKCSNTIHISEDIPIYQYVICEEYGALSHCTSEK